MFCPKCGKKYKSLRALKKHVKECFPRLTPEEIWSLRKELKQHFIIEYFPQWERPY